MINGWVLIVLGITYLSRASDDIAEYGGEGRFSHSFLPILYAVTKSETTAAYQSLSFRSLVTVVSIFYPDRVLRVHSVTMVHCYPILNAAMLFFGPLIIIDCWAHVARKISQGKVWVAEEQAVCQYD
jgi:hypothetical protein